MYASKKHLICGCLLFLMTAACLVQAQNETKQWRFAAGGALNFLTNPPTNLSTAPGNNNGVTASIADAAGNLLFYTNGSNIWNSSNNLMANGNGLETSPGYQSALILQKPGSVNLYYVFTLKYNYFDPSNGLYYSIVDMSLAAGQGSVTVKNVWLYAGPLCKKLTGTKNAAGNGYWVVVKDCFDTNAPLPPWNGIYSFRSFALTAAGINAQPAVSTFTYANPTNYTYAVKAGQMKISPNGKKLACANYAFDTYNSNVGTFELYDFDKSTGLVSNFAPLYNTPTGAFSPTNGQGWGVEFSPDASKLYGTLSDNINYPNGSILEWDLCPANNAVAATQMSIAAPSNTINGFACMQLGPDGKIYVAHYNINFNTLSVINFPNLYGAATGFNLSSISVSPSFSQYMLPNFIGSSFFLASSVPAFSLSLLSSTIGCQAFQFQSPMPLGAVTGTCPSTSYTLQNLQWDFGDPASGFANSSTLSNPSHTYSAVGIYTVNLLLDFGDGTYTLTQTVNITSPGFGNLNYTGSLACNGSTAGAAFYVNQQGSNFAYSWTNGATTYTSSSPTITGLSAGTWSSVVTNMLNACQMNTVFTITQPSPITVSLATACLNQTLQANASGGTGSLSYFWSNGSTAPITSFYFTGPYTITMTDANGCTQVSGFTVLPTPVISVPNATICVGDTATLSATGANNYTWSNNVAGPLLMYSNPIAGQYTVGVTGTSANCTSSVAVFINVSDCSSGLNEVAGPNGLKVFPNPSSGLVNIEVREASALIWNALGQVILSTEIREKQQIRIDTPGIYFLKISSGRQSSTRKIIITE